MVGKRRQQPRWHKGQEQRAQHSSTSLRDERIVPGKDQGTGMVKAVKNTQNTQIGYFGDKSMLQTKEISDPGFRSFVF